MKFKNDNLSIFNEDKDLSFILSNFKETELVSLNESNYLYIGFSKPINTLYFDIEKESTLKSKIIIEKISNNVWSKVSSLDCTNSFNESGFIYLNEFKEEQKTIINNQEMFWVRISSEAEISDIEFRFINLLFCDKKDLIKKDSTIHTFYPYDENDNKIKTHILALMAGRDWVTMEINKLGKFKSYNGIQAHLISYWDIMNINEVRDIAEDMALYTMYDNANDSEGYYEKQRDILLKRAVKNFNKFTGGFLLTLDLNQDGKVDDNEKFQSTVIVQRVIR